MARNQQLLTDGHIAMVNKTYRSQDKRINVNKVGTFPQQMTTR